MIKKIFLVLLVGAIIIAIRSKTTTNPPPQPSPSISRTPTTTPKKSPGASKTPRPTSSVSPSQSPSVNTTLLPEPNIGPDVIIISPSKTSTAHSLQGFLNGVGYAASETLDATLVSQLKPKFWRIVDFVYYDKLRQFKPAFTFILGEAYVNLKGGWDKAKPWENWKEWEDFAKLAVEHSKKTNRPVAYWEMWGEPDLDGGTQRKGSYSQYLEFVARGYRAVHAADSNAKVIGPGVSQFVPRFREGSGEVIGLARFISDLATIHQVKLEGISWHELGSNPEEVPAHTAALRQYLTQTFPGYNPELHVNEFSAQADHLIPGWSVAWLYYLEQARVDVANRACWNVRVSAFSTWNDCWTGLNGLLLQDNKTPQHTYWVHKAYADLGPRRITTESPLAKIVSLASRDDAKKEIRILIGRYTTRGPARASAQNVTIAVKPHPYSEKNVSVAINRIPHASTPGALLRPLETTISAPLQGSTVLISLPSLGDGEAVELRITPLP